MRTQRDAKLMATTLRRYLQHRQVELSHSESLEIVARQFGMRNWNVLAARLEASEPPHRPPLALPLGWGKTGRNPDAYAAGVDPDVEHEGLHAAVIRSRAPDGEAGHPEDGFATLMQTVSATPWLGRRIALEAKLRTLDVDGAGAIWLRIDSSTGRMIAFDNMEGRSTGKVLTGTQAWTSRRIVLDVAAEAGQVNYGFMLRGTGSVWAASFTIGEAAPDSATTDHRGWLHERPQNLDFSRLEPPEG